MKVKLVVASGVHEGREIPLAGAEFLIGRDPQCQLRPSSPAISKRHCAVMIRGGKVYVRDFGSTNGTFIDGTSVQGEIEVNNQARLKAGPLDFKIVIEETKPAPAPTPTPAAKAKTPAQSADDELAAFLLEGDEGPATPAIPDGSTVMEIAAKDGETGEPKPDAKPAAKKPDEQGDTRSAAADILSKYRRRPRS